MSQFDLDEVVDTDRYPVCRLDSAQGVAWIDELRAALATRGAASILGFIRASALPAMIDEALALVPLAYPGPTRVSPYFFNYDLAEGRPADHPTRHEGARNMAQVAYDLIPEQSLLCQLYHSDVITNLVARVQGKLHLHRLADRYQSLNISVMNEGGCQQWHFDRGHLVTTLLLQAAQRGGVFEYVPRIRSDDDEHFDDVERVLAGDRAKVREIPIVPGTLNLFQGHYSMHRVTPVEGTRQRLQTIFAFADEPDTVGSSKSSILHYGERAISGYRS